MTKADLLTLLRERADFISGQELCDYFGVSRTAVWKAMNRLKEEGYEIEAVQNRGYRLSQEGEIYGQNELTSRIQTKWVGKPAHFYESLGSTNTQAKKEAEDGAGSGTLIVADRQTAGRGRRGREWNSPQDSNIYFTLLLRPEFAPDKAPMMTIVMAMAVAESIRKILPEAKIKWPNDIVINGRKVCGILTEMSVERDYIQYVVIGVGINVKKQEFPKEIAAVASSLEEEAGKNISRSVLIADIMQAFEEFYEVFCQTEDLSRLKNRYNGMLVSRGKEICVLDPKGEYHGVSGGINDRGELLVEREDKSVTAVYAGEVSVRGIYGYAN